MAAVTSPQALFDLLLGVVRAAAERASGAPDALSAILAEALSSAGEAMDFVELPRDGELFKRLTDLVDPPDWSSLLVYGLLQVAKLDDRLRVGVLPADGEWSKAVAITFSEGEASATLALALTDPGLTHGVIVRTGGTLRETFPRPDQPSHVTLTTSGTGEWRIRFPSGPVTSIGNAAELEGSVRIRLDRVVGDISTASGIAIGPLRATFNLGSGAQLWAVDVGLGDAAQSGISFDPGELLKLIPEIPVLDLGADRGGYSPTVHAGAGQPTTLDLGHKGA